ncbi:biotin-dependent carboxyltransferase family protein [Thalassotalea sp. PLHSN55]|uniref:5-oxoprolinase subunit C family protein n=1 Tax=Thalassotalea sp. PLHSN55 TaxID=3435888 RepID=UPI003F866F70
MTNRIEIIDLKGNCSIQDLGRDKAQHLGFSGSGASDEYSFLMANQLINNVANSPALEITLGQIQLLAHSDTQFAITGADCRATVNDKPIKNWAVHSLNTGDVLTLKQPMQHLHSYLAFLGGIVCDTFFASHSQTLNEQQLALTAKKLAAGSFIELYQTGNMTPAETQQLFTITKVNQRATSPLLFHASEQLTLRFIPSPMWWQLSDKKRNFFTEQSYEILPQSNRMGYRLSSDVLFNCHGVNDKPANLSKPVCYGTIQLPDNGQPIVLMKERQTIGGYPVLGTVMKTDLFRLAQKRPGQHVRFATISIEQAQQQLAAFYQKLNVETY